MRKVLALLLIAAMTLLAVCAAGAEEAPVIAVDTVTAKAGEEAEVSVSIRNSPGITAVRVQISFGEGLMLTGVSEGTMGKGIFMGPQTLGSPFYVVWTYGTGNVSGDGVLARLTFRVKEDAAPGWQPITVSYDPDDVYGVDLSTYTEANVTFGIVNGGVQVESGNTSCTHRYAPYVSNGDALCTEDGTKSAVCELCGNRDTVTDPGSAPGHDFSRKREETDCQVPDTGTDCRSQKAYYYSCSRCGALGTETFPGASSGAHTVGEQWFWENGIHFRRCTAEGCDYREAASACSGDTGSCSVCGHVLTAAATGETEPSVTEGTVSAESEGTAPTEPDGEKEGKGLLIAAAAALTAALAVCVILVITEIRKKR